MKASIVALFGLIVFLSVVDVAANMFGFIPILGDILSTMEETVNESLQLILVAAGLAMAGRK